MLSLFYVCMNYEEQVQDVCMRGTFWFHIRSSLLPLGNHVPALAMLGCYNILLFHSAHEVCVAHIFMAREQVIYSAFCGTDSSQHLQALALGVGCSVTRLLGQEIRQNHPLIPFQPTSLLCELSLHLLILAACACGA